MLENVALFRNLEYSFLRAEFFYFSGVFSEFGENYHMNSCS